MDQHHLIFFLLSVLAWTSETSCSFIRISEDLMRTEAVQKHEGETLKFPCSSSNSPTGGELQWWTYNPLLRQIHSNGTRVFTHPEKNNGQSSVVLNIKNLTLSDSKIYHCISYRNGDHIQTNLRIQLKVVPKDKAGSSTAMNSRNSGENQLKQKDKKEGQSFGTSHISTPSPEATYVQCWVVHSDGDLELIDSNDVTVFKTNNGRNSVLLDVRNLQVGDPNDYYCVDNRGETYVPVHLALEILPKELPAVVPTIPKDLSSNELQYVYEETPVEFSCSSPTAVDLEWWTHNDGQLEKINSNTGRVSVIPEEDDQNRSLILRIENLQLSDTKKYFCFDNKMSITDTYQLVIDPLELVVIEKKLVPVELNVEKFDDVKLETPRMEPAAPEYVSLRIEPLLPVEGDMAKVVCTLNLTMGPLKNLEWTRYTETGTLEVIVPTSSDFSTFSLESNRNETKYEEILTIKDLQLSDAREYGCSIIGPPRAGLTDYAFVPLPVKPKPKPKK